MLGGLERLRRVVAGRAPLWRLISATSIVAGAALVVTPNFDQHSASAAVGDFQVSASPITPVANAECGPGGFGRVAFFPLASNSGNYPAVVGTGQIVMDVTKTNGLTTGAGTPSSFTINSILDNFNGQDVYFSDILLRSGNNDPAPAVYTLDNAVASSTSELVGPLGNPRQLYVCAFPLQRYRPLKDVIGNAPDLPGSFDISTSCLPPNGSTGWPSYDMAYPTLDTLGDGSTELSSFEVVPAGFDCAVVDSAPGYVTDSPASTIPSRPLGQAIAQRVITDITATNSHYYSLEISKSVFLSFPGDPDTFEIAVECVDADLNFTVVYADDGVTPITSVTLADTESVIVLARGATTCSLTEPNLDPELWESDQPTVEMTGDQFVSVSNTRRAASVYVQKHVVYPPELALPPASEFDHLFAVTADCWNVDGVSSIPLDLVPPLGDGESSPELLAPVGASCDFGESLTAEELARWTVDAPFGVLVSEQMDPLSTVTNTRKVGTLTVENVVVPADLAVPPGGFGITFDVVCDEPEYGGLGIVIEPGAPYTEVIPTDVNCTINENDPGAGWIWDPAPIDVTITDTMPGATAVFINSRDSTDLSITKVVDNGYDGVFTFDVDCDGTEFDRLDPNPVVIDSAAANPSEVLAGIPVGVSCTITERAVDGWSVSAIDGGSANVAAGTTDITIESADAPGANAVVFSNLRDTGTLTVEKSVDGGPDTGTFLFTFSVDCNNGEFVQTDVQVVIDRPDTTGTSTPLEVPTGDCVVDETGWSPEYQPAAAQTIVVGPTADATATVMNHFVVADLGITKTATPSIVQPGTNITYTLTVTNHGPDGATDATMSDPLPANTTFVSLASPAGWTCATPAVGATGSVDCTSADLAVDGTAVFTLVVNVDADTIEVSVVNDAFVSATTPEPGDATFPNDDTVSTPVGEPDLGVVKTGPASADAGAPFTYTIEVTNHGSIAVANPVLVDSLPSNATFQSLAVGGAGAWAAGDCGAPVGLVLTCDASGSLAPGATATFSLTFVSAPDAGGTQVINSATASSAQAEPELGEPNTDDHTVELTTAAAIGITKTAIQEFAVPGAEVTFEITVDAYGPSTSEGIKVTDETPTGLTFVSSTCPDHTYDEGASMLTCTIGTLDPADAPATFSVTYVVSDSIATTTVTNTADVEATTSEPPNEPHLNSATVTVPVVRYSVEKRVATAPAPPEGGYALGDTIDFDIVVTNLGNITLQDVTVTDDMPDANLGACTVDGGAVALPATIPATAVLVCHATHVVTQADLDAGVYVNQATADSTQGDPRTGSVEVVLPGNPSLAVVKSATAAGPFALSSVVTFDVIVTNNGTLTLTNVALAEQADATLGTCSVALPATLAPGASFTCAATHTITVADGVAGSYTNAATASGTDPDGAPVTSTGTIAVVTSKPPVDLQLTKTLMTSMTTGANVTWRLDVKNAGPGPDAGVFTLDSLPSSLEFVSAVGEGWICSDDGETVTCATAAPIAAGSSLPSVFITTRVSAFGGTIVANTATVSGTGTDSLLTNNSSTANGAVAAVAAAAIVPFVPSSGVFVAGVNTRALPGTGASSVTYMLYGFALVLVGGLLFGLTELSRRRQRRA
jgi:uncharacterized repeat protein (TIGR01451 family)